MHKFKDQWLTYYSIRSPVCYYPVFLKVVCAAGTDRYVSVEMSIATLLRGKSEFSCSHLGRGLVFRYIVVAFLS